MQDLSRNCDKIQILGLSGKIGSGKTSCAEALKEYLSINNSPHKVVFVNFADKLKEEVAYHLNIPVADCYTHEGKNKWLVDYFMSVGSFQQLWGTTLREMDPNIWIKGLNSHILKEIESMDILKESESMEDDHGTNDDQKEKKEKNKKMLFIVGDVRFENEAEWILNNCNGSCVRLNGDPGGERKKSTRNLDHISETALDNFNKFSLILNTNENSIEQVTSELLKLLKL